MDITFSCDKCGQQIAISEAEAGHFVDCSKCKRILLVPFLSELPVEAPQTAQPVQPNLSASLEPPVKDTSKPTAASGSTPIDSSAANLQNCQDCGKQISKRAASCPHCGAPTTPTVATASPQNAPSTATLSNTANPLIKIYTILIVIAVMVGVFLAYEFWTSRQVSDWRRQFNNWRETEAKQSELSSLLQKAEAGDVFSQNYLGLIYASGTDVPKDYTKAMVWFRKAAEQGDADAMESLARLYGNSDKELEDKTESEKWYRKAVNSYRKAAEQGSSSSQLHLGSAYEFGNGVTKNYFEAAKWYRMAAEKGDSMAQKCLGEAYENGRGVAQDSIEAYKWYNLAVIQYGYKNSLFEKDRDKLSLALAPEQIAEGERRAAEFLANKKSTGNQSPIPPSDSIQQVAAIATSNGTGTPIGEGQISNATATALKTLKETAEAGDAKAQYSLGYAYWNGEGVAKDTSKAMKWLRKAAEQGNMQAQEWLQVVYGGGYGIDGVKKDASEAAKWKREAVESYRKAAEQGDAKAQYKLGRAYSDGEVVSKDDVEAVKWVRKAAEQGNADAQGWLGRCYKYGKGVARDYVEAYKWYSLANKQAAIVADGFYTSVEPLAKDMTPEQIAEGKRRAAEFVPKKAEHPGVQ